jgi:phosphomannomutase
VLDRKAGGAVIITASHNPGEWNGFKYKPEYAGSAAPEIVEKLEARIRELQRADAA